MIYKSQRTLSFFDGSNQQCFFLKTAIETMAKKELGGVDRRGQQCPACYASRPGDETYALVIMTRCRERPATALRAAWAGEPARLCWSQSRMHTRQAWRTAWIHSEAWAHEDGDTNSTTGNACDWIISETIWETKDYVLQWLNFVLLWILAGYW